MPKVKLTDAAVQRFKAPPGGRVEYFDATLPGFALRVAGPTPRNPEGRRTWCLFYRFGGEQKRLSFYPPYPGLSLADAREQAGDALALLSKGTDPAVVKAATKAEAARPRDTVSTVVEQFIRLHLERKKRSAIHITETQRKFDKYVLPVWGDRDIKSITRRDVIELLDGIADGGGVAPAARKGRASGGPIAANRTLAAISTMFNWALRRGIIEASPATLVEKPGEEHRRERALGATEIRTLWQAFGSLEYPFGHFFMMTLLTGQRREEVAGMRWADIDLEERTWTIPAELTKRRRIHVVPLAPAAVSLLTALPRKTVRNQKGETQPSPYVFTTGGDRPISGFSKGKARVDAAVVQACAADQGEPLEPWTIHDLRRTVATELARLGIARLVISKVLNHSDRSVTGIYDRYAYLPEKRHALETWARYLEGLTQPAGDNVVELRA